MRTTMASREQREFSERLDLALAAGIARCETITSEAVNMSHVTYWKLFCQSIGREESWIQKELGGHRVDIKQEEEALLLKFTCFVATCPRDRRKITKGDTKSAAYALHVTSSVRAWAERAVGRKIGTAGYKTQCENAGGCRNPGARRSSGSTGASSSHTAGVVATTAGSGPATLSRRWRLLGDLSLPLLRHASCEGSAG